MHREILSDISKNFSKDPEYWDWIARLEMTNSGTIQEKIEKASSCHIYKKQFRYTIPQNHVYEEASIMFNLFIKFFMDVVGRKRKEDRVSGLPNHTEDYI